MHEAPFSDDRSEVHEPTDSTSNVPVTGGSEYDGVVCDAADQEPDIPDGPPPSASESGETTGEWLPKFDIDTTLLDVLTRPSAFNPRPDLASGGMEVLDISEMTANPRMTIKYVESNTATGSVLPLSEVSAPDAVEDREDGGAREPIPAEEMDRHIREAVGIPDANWIPMYRYWANLSADLASTHIMQEDGHQAVEEIKEIAVAHAVDMDDPYDTGYGKYVHTDPQEFVKAGIAAAQAAIENGDASRAYAIAHETFRGFSYPIGNNTQVSNGANLWATDKDGMPDIVFPALEGSWDTREPDGQVSGARAFDVGKHVTTIVRGRLYDAAVEGWIGQNADTASPAAIEKAWLLHQRITLEREMAENKLRVCLENARRQNPDVTWEIPDNLADYVFDRLAA